MVIFVFPLFLLGTVTPSLVKYTVDSLDDSGKTVGKLNASNTIGSIIGTFVPTFISIPAVGTSITFLIFSGILLLLAILYFISGYENERFHKGNLKIVIIGIILFVLCCIFGHKSNFAFWRTDLTVEDESVYNYLQVYEDEREVVLSTNVLFGVQSVYNKEKGLTGMYYDYAMAAPYMSGNMHKDKVEVLILGMGTGTYATQCSRYFDNVNCEGVEIDEKITKLAREYFSLPEEVKVTTYDGRAFLQADERKYDVIMVDAYQDISIPFQMSSTEFFTMVKNHLTPDGVMVVNMNMRGDGEGDINEYLSDTIAAVFSEVYTVDVAFNTNRELFASNNPDMITEFRECYGLEQDPALIGMMQKVDEGLVRYEAGNRIMTDDRAPVELLSMKAMDALIAGEVSYYKTIFEEQGIEGVINALM